MFDFNIDCRIPSDICDSIVIYRQAGQIISNNLVLTSKIKVNVVVDDQSSDSFGGASAQTTNYVDPEDGVIRLYPTALMKQLDPNFKSDDGTDISMEVNINREGNFWFQDANEGPIEPKELDFLEFILHELHHGLGIKTFWNKYKDDSIGVGLVPYLDYHYNGGKLTFDAFYETIFDKFLVSLRGGALIKTYTKALNDMAGPRGKQYNDLNDFYTQLRDKQKQEGKSYTLDMLEIATNQNRLGFLITVVDDASVNAGGIASAAIPLETSYNPPVLGKSIEHLDNGYGNTEDFLFLSVLKTGSTLQEQITANGDYPGGGVGPSLFTMLESIGYKLRLPPRHRNLPAIISKISN